MYYLMNKDTPVLGYDLDDRYIVVMDNNMLPYNLKDHIKTTEYISKETAKKAEADINTLRYFLADRILPVGRPNINAILGSSQLPKNSGMDNMLKISEACCALSMNDNFWIKKENEDILYKDVDIRQNRLSSYAYDVAIIGKHISLTARELRAELVTGGSYPKFWKRTKISLELWKTDNTTSFMNTQAEIDASDILDHTNIQHVRYRPERQDGRLFAVSKCASAQTLSHVSAQSIIDWHTHTGKDFLKWVEEKFPEDFHKMVFADYILANTDRHTENWWFKVDPASNAITGFGPLMDHNLSLIADRFHTDIDDIIYDPTNMTFAETIEKYAPFINELVIEPCILPEPCRERYEKLKSLKKSIRNC